MNTVLENASIANQKIGSMLFPVLVVSPIKQQIENTLPSGSNCFKTRCAASLANTSMPLHCNHLFNSNKNCIERTQSASFLLRYYHHNNDLEINPRTITNKIKKLTVWAALVSGASKKSYTSGSTQQRACVQGMGTKAASIRRVKERMTPLLTRNSVHYTKNVRT